MGSVGPAPKGMFSCMEAGHGGRPSPSTAPSTGQASGLQAFSNPFSGWGQSSAVGTLSQQARSLGLSQATIAKLDNRLRAGNYQLAGTTVNTSSNLPGSATRDPQEIETRANEALTNLKEMANAPIYVAQVAVQSLADNGVMPKWLGNPGNGQSARPFLRTYSIGLENQTGSVQHLQIAQNDWNVQRNTTNGTIQLEKGTRPVPPQEVGQQGSRISFRPSRTYRNQPSAINDQLRQQVAVALTSPAQSQQIKRLISQLPQLLNGNNPQVLQGAIDPLAQGISQSLGLSGITFVVRSFKGDAMLNTWAASYDDQNDTLTINSDAMASKLAQATQVHGNGSQAATDAMAYLTSAITHELAHAVQERMIANPQAYGLTADSPVILDLKENQLNYTTPNLSEAVTGTYFDYFTQPLELLANRDFQTPTANATWAAAGVPKPASTVSEDDWIKKINASQTA